ncbi:hypothetical protein [Intestinicryptomonas porci]|uniref:Uncharacterized protein n=1 Tax=Intestinicryptomonas porci TaxID=2926320 RepID=A0ABU4WIH6_9BACT|nr:hypothetical protein [Opitutales bacterium CLA-KB-P66]
MQNISRLLISTGTLTIAREDPRSGWEYFELPPSQQKKQQKNSTPKKRNLFKALLDAFKMP